MSITTQVIWANGTPSLQAKRSLHNQIIILKNQGVTDGNFTQTIVDNNLLVHRIWTTTEAATNWITFVSDFSPISAEVLPQ